MKNKKMLKVLSTSFILGTILMTNPTGAEKAEDLSLSEKLVDNQDLTNSVTSETKETKVVSGESETTEEKTPELINDGDSKENSEKLELSSDVEKQSVRGTREVKNTQSAYEKQMEIDDPFEYDYTGYVVNNMKTTNEGDMQNPVLSLSDHIHHDNQKDLQGSGYKFYDSKDISEEINDALNNSKNQEELDHKINQIKEKYQIKDENSGFYNYLNNFTSDGANIGKTDFNDIKKKQDINEGVLKQYYKNHSLFVFYIGDNFVNDLIKESEEEISFFLTRQRFKEINSIYQKMFLNEYQNKYNTKIHDRWVTFSDQDTQNNVSYIPQNVGRKTILNDKGNIEIEITNLVNNGILDKTAEMYFEHGVIRNSSKSLKTNKVYGVSISSPSFMAEEYGKASNKVTGYSTDYTISVVGDNKYEYIADNSLAFKDIKKDDLKSNRVMYVTNYKESYDKFYESLLKSYNEGLKEAEKSGEYTKEQLAEMKENFIRSAKEQAEDFVKDCMRALFTQNTGMNNTLDEILETDKPNLQFLADFYGSDKWGIGTPIAKVGNVDTKTEEQDFKVIKKEDSTLTTGETKVVKKGVKGKKVTKITYTVNRTSGELTDPVSEIVEDTKPVDEVILVGTKKVTPATPIEDIATTTKTTKEVIKAEISYKADETLEFEKQNVAIKPINGEKEITTVSQSGKKDVVTEKVIKDKVDGVTKVGNKKVEVETKDGVTTTTTTIYEVEKETGKLVNPKVTTHKTTKIGTLEDIATTTKITKEVIKAEISYEADETLEFEKQNVVTKPINGEKEITTVSQSGKKDVVTAKVIKDKVDGVTKVGNKKVEVETKDGVTTTITTIYEVEKGTGKLVNPKVTTHKTTKAGIIEDIAKKTIPATKIEDIAKKTIPATKIEDIAKKTIPATKIEDIAKKTIPATKIEDIAKKTMPATKIEDIAKNTNKNDEKDNSNEPKKVSHLPKAGVNSEILTLAVGALATIGGINLSKKRRK